MVTRVLEGGHHISEEVIERRYVRSMRNLFGKYLTAVDGVFMLDNSFGDFTFIAKYTPASGLMEYDIDRVAKLKSQAT